MGCSESQQKIGSAEETSSGMPFFKWGSGMDKNAKAKLEQKLCLAKDNPEPIFDLSECQLTEVPSGVYSMCRVFRKESLYLHQNQLSNLNGGGLLQDLSLLKVLDLHSNKFTTLPDDISHLKNLKVLNLADNKLKTLPPSFSGLSRLKVLNLQGNRFKEFPKVLCQMENLQNLNIQGCERITSLPQELASLSSSLETLSLDAENFQYPPPDVCKEGTEAVMKFLCTERGTEYKAPSKDPSSPTRSEGRSSTASGERLSTSEFDVPLPASFHSYQAAKEQRMAALLNWEEQYRDSQQSQAQLAADAKIRREKLLHDFAEEQERLLGELEQVQIQKDQEKKKLLHALNSLEIHSSQLIDHLIKSTDKSKDMLKEVIEKDKQEAEELFMAKQEELDSLRKKDILEAMKKMLLDEERQREYEKLKMENSKKLAELSEEGDSWINSILNERQADQQTILNQLIEEEQVQRKAFETLQLKKDQAHSYLTHQIKLIEKELGKLTTAELKKQDLKINLELNILAEHRAALAELLSLLLQKKEEREKELKLRIIQMEEQRANEAADFWFVQYQRLMDKKPIEISSMEEYLDPIVKEVLTEAGALPYLTLFAVKGITAAHLATLDMEKLRQLGIFDEKTCKDILDAIFKVMTKEKEVEVERNPEPSAPLEPEEESIPSAPPLPEDEDIKVWSQTECVVCMDHASSLVFLPCGHFCCCQRCGNSLSQCPMCRVRITSIFTMGGGPH